MPVNMNPNKRHRKKGQEPEPQEAAQETAEGAKAKETEAAAQGAPEAKKNLDEPTEADLAEKEWTHLWDATEVIDMDKW